MKIERVLLCLYRVILYAAVAIILYVFFSEPPVNQHLRFLGFVLLVLSEVYYRIYWWWLNR